MFSFKYKSLPGLEEFKNFQPEFALKLFSILGLSLLCITFF